jgi:ribosomal protein L24
VVKTVSVENHANVENLKFKRKKVARTYAQIVPVTTANVEILAIVDTARKKRKVTKNQKDEVPCYKKEEKVQ